VRKASKGRPSLAGMRQPGKRLKMVDPRLKKDKMKKKANMKKGGGRQGSRKPGARERKQKQGSDSSGKPEGRGTKRKR